MRRAPLRVGQLSYLIYEVAVLKNENKYIVIAYCGMRIY